MDYVVIRTPFMLQETVSMLYKYINEIHFKETLTRRKFLAGNAIPDGMERRLNRLQEIMEEVCAGVDVNNEQFQYFFQCIDGTSSDICLAILMTFSFSRANFPALEDNAEEICAYWESAEKNHLCLNPNTVGTLMLNEQNASQLDLFDQVCRLAYPSDFKLKLYGALRNFRKTMNALIDLIRPLANRLEAMYRQEPWLMEEAAQYWEEVFSKSAPEEVARNIFSSDVLGDAPGVLYVLPQLMNSRFVAYGTDTIGSEPYSLLILGSGVTSNSRLQQQDRELDRISTILKAIGDRRRLEILHYLSKHRSYCHELANTMEMDSGNMSRHLSLLHSYGLLHQTREPMVHYYETDKSALHDFFHLAEDMICN